MFLAVNKEDVGDYYAVSDLSSLVNQDAFMYNEIADYDFYTCTKINVREIPARLEIVKEVTKPAVVRKPTAKAVKK